MLTTVQITFFTICIIILELITPTEDFVVESAPFDIEGNFKYFIYIDTTIDLIGVLKTVMHYGIVSGKQ